MYPVAGDVPAALMIYPPSKVACFVPAGCCGKLYSNQPPRRTVGVSMPPWATSPQLA